MKVELLCQSLQFTFDIVSDKMTSFSNYRRQIFKPGSRNTHITPWGQILVKNRNKQGDLISYRTLRELKKGKKMEWAVCSLLIFKDNNRLYPFFKCNLCDCCKSVETLSMNQPEMFMNGLKCYHSQIADLVVSRTTDDWKTIWPLEYDDIEDVDIGWKVECNTHIKHIVFEDDSKCSTFLGAVYMGNRKGVSIIANLSKSSKALRCYKCTTRNCKCIRSLKHHLDNEKKEDEEYEHFDRRTKSKPRVSEHYEETPPFPHLGYNRTYFRFPFFRDVGGLKEKFQDRCDGIDSVILPEKFEHEYVQDQTCKHGVNFDPDPQNLIKKYSEVTVYYEFSEITIDIPMFARKSLGPCRCLILPDTHQFMLQNCGGGRLIDYGFLADIVCGWCQRTGVLSKISARADRFRLAGRQTTLPVNVATEAIASFCHFMQSEDSDWVCDKCCRNDAGDLTTTPQFLVADAKAVGLKNRRVEHLQELDRAPDDDQVLPGGSDHRQRVFLADKEERALLR